MKVIKYMGVEFDSPLPRMNISFFHQSFIQVSVTDYDKDMTSFVTHTYQK